MCHVSLKYMELDGRGNDLKIASFFSFLRNFPFGNSKRVSCKASWVKFKFFS